MSSRNTRVDLHDEGKKKAKWLMKQAEKDGQQTVFLLNLLQDLHREIEARDDVMLESSKLVSKLQAENETLRQQLLERDNTGAQEQQQQQQQQHGNAAAARAQQRDGASRISGGAAPGSKGGEPSTRLPANRRLAPPSQDCESPRGANASASGGGGSSSTLDAGLNPRPKCSTLHAAWARMRMLPEADPSAAQAQPPTSTPIPTPRPAACESPPTPQACGPVLPAAQPVPPQVSARAAPPLQRQAALWRDAVASEAGSNPAEVEAHPPLLRPEPQQQQPMAPPPQQQPLHRLLQPQVPQSTQPTQPAQLPQQQPQAQPSQQPTQPLSQLSPPPQAPASPPPPPTQQQQQQSLEQQWRREARVAALSAEGEALREQLTAARREAAAATSDFLTTKKDLEVLHRKYDSLMLQKLEAEEQRDRLFNPQLDMTLVRAAMPAVDAALGDAEERLAAMVEMLAAAQVEANDAARMHQEQRRKWIAKLEEMQAQLAARDARLAELEAATAAPPPAGVTAAAAAMVKGAAAAAAVARGSAAGAGAGAGVCRVGEGQTVAAVAEALGLDVMVVGDVGGWRRAASGGGRGVEGGGGGGCEGGGLGGLQALAGALSCA